MAKIFVTRHVPGPGLELLKNAGHELVISEVDRPLTQDELVGELSKTQYDGVLTLLTDTINGKIYDAAPSVKVYSNYAVGFNNIDIDEAKKRGIAIGNTPGTSTNAVAEFAATLVLNVAKRVNEGDDFIRAGKYAGWNPNLLIGTEIRGKTFGLIGAGHIGSQAAETLVKGFGMKVIYEDLVQNAFLEKDLGAERKATVEDVLKEADVVSLHVLLNESTHHLINKERLALMKPGAILVNTSRGPVVDELALIEALKNKQIRGAGIDVYEFEPNISEELKSLSNVVLTPHIASATEQTRDAMSIQAAENLIEFFAGRPVKYKVV